jgi:predicted MPP superfamily phosphohydrolase
VADPRIDVPMSRRRFLQRGTRWVLGTGLALLVESLLEPSWLEVKEVTVRLKRLPQAFDGLRVVQFSDVHLGHFFDLEDLARVVEELNRLEPDVLVFTGDMVDHPIPDVAEAGPILAKCRARYGKWGVLGNHDMKSERAVLQMMRSAGFEMLPNKNAVLEKDGQRLYLAGLDDAYFSRDDMGKALQGIPQGECVVLLAHYPDVADEVAKHGVDLQLSGHSHGGQVRLPGVGHLVTPPLARVYVEGLLQIVRDGLQLYVNRGLGTTGLPIRFFCRPELTVLTLVRG